MTSCTEGFAAPFPGRYSPDSSADLSTSRVHVALHGRVVFEVIGHAGGCIAALYLTAVRVVRILSVVVGWRIPLQ